MINSRENILLEEGGNMFLAKYKIGYLFLVVFSFLLFPTMANAIDNPTALLPINGNNSPGVLSPDNKTILDLSEGSRLQKPCMWGNDVLVAGGSIEGGFSADYDNNGYIYAARCSTYLDVSNAYIRVYKSTDGGASWSLFTYIYYDAAAYTFSKPVVLTGSNPPKVYIFALGSSQNGDIGVARLSQTGVWEGWYYIKADADTISDFSVCTDDGSHLMLAYQKEANGHRIYTIVSTDSGTTWGNQIYFDDMGMHPDIAYGTEGYVYLVWEKNRDGDSEIWFYRNNNYCLTSTWSGLDSLTVNSSNNTYPKIAALHSIPKDTACVWVVYNHYSPPPSKVTNIDLNFAYSTNSGTNWTKDQVIANDPYSNEMAADIRAYRYATSYVDLCYLKASMAKSSGLDIIYSYSSYSYPDSFKYLDTINNYPANWSDDSREVCQLVPITTSPYPGIMYASILLKEAGAPNLDASWNLYFDQKAWSDVNDNPTAEQSSAKFSLSANYPNPFNPETRINYSISQACRVKLEIFNILGQKIRTLVDEKQSVGNKEVVWDGRNENGEQAASGVYFYRLQAKDFVQTKKMVLMR